MTHASRRGFALAAALLALTLIAVLVAGVFFATMEETRVGAAVAERQLALSAAESAIEMIIARRIGAVVSVKTALDGSITVDRVSERWWSELF